MPASKCDAFKEMLRGPSFWGTGKTSDAELKWATYFSAVTLFALLASGCFGKAIESKPVSNTVSNTGPKEDESMGAQESTVAQEGLSDERPSGDRPIESDSSRGGGQGATPRVPPSGTAGSDEDENVPLETPTGCDDPKTKMELGGKPPAQWWTAFVEEQESVVVSPNPGARAPRVAMSVYGVAEDAEPYVAIRSRLGELRLCYEQALAVTPELTGFWVATVEQSIEGGVCSVAPVPGGDEQAPGTCFADALQNWPSIKVTGRFHIAVSFFPR